MKARYIKRIITGFAAVIMSVSLISCSDSKRVKETQNPAGIISSADKNLSESKFKVPEGVKTVYDAKILNGRVYMMVNEQISDKSTGEYKQYTGNSVYIMDFDGNVTGRCPVQANQHYLVLDDEGNIYDCVNSENAELVTNIYSKEGKLTRSITLQGSNTGSYQNIKQATNNCIIIYVDSNFYLYNTKGELIKTMPSPLEMSVFTEIDNKLYMFYNEQGKLYRKLISADSDYGKENICSQLYVSVFDKKDTLTGDRISKGDDIYDLYIKSDNKFYGYDDQKNQLTELCIGDQYDLTDMNVLVYDSDEKKMIGIKQDEENGSVAYLYQ